MLHHILFSGTLLTTIGVCDHSHAKEDYKGKEYYVEVNGIQAHNYCEGYGNNRLQIGVDARNGWRNKL